MGVGVTVMLTIFETLAAIGSLSFREGSLSFDGLRFVCGKQTSDAEALNTFSLKKVQFELCLTNFL